MLAGCANTTYLDEPRAVYPEIRQVAEEHAGAPGLARAEYERLLAGHPAPDHDQPYYQDLLHSELRALTKDSTALHLSDAAILGVVSAFDQRCEAAAELHRRVAQTYVAEGQWAAAETSAREALAAAEKMRSVHQEAESSRTTWALLSKDPRPLKGLFASLRSALCADFEGSPRGRRALVLQRQVAQEDARRVADLRHHLWEIEQRRRNVASLEQGVDPNQALATTASLRELLAEREEIASGGLLSWQLRDPDAGGDPVGLIKAFVAEAQASAGPDVAQALQALGAKADALGRQRDGLGDAQAAAAEVLLSLDAVASAIAAAR